MKEKLEISAVVPQKSEKECFQITVILIAASQGFVSGALSGWTSPFMVKIVEDKVNYNIREDQAALFAVVNVVGLIVLSPFLEPFVDIIGRKKAILLTSVPYILCWLTKALFTNLWALYFARLLVGLGDALLMCVIPIYIGEVATPKVRGVWGNAFFILVLFGTFIINVIGIYCSVKVTSYFFLILQVIVLFLSAFIIPESPSFYIAKNQLSEAKISLMKLRQNNNVDIEFTRMQNDIKRQLSESGTWTDLFFNHVNRKALIIAAFLRAAQILSGLWVFGSYTQFVFQKVGSSISSEASTILYTALNFIICASMAYGSNKFGRRKSLIMSLAGSSVIFLLVGFYFLVEKLYPQINLHAINWFPLAGLIVFLFVSSFGIGPIPVLMQGELFSASIKSKGISAVVVVYGLLTIGTNSTFYYLYAYSGLSGPFLLFGVCNFISIIVTYFIVPETKGKTLEEIQQYLKTM
ncbi:facilitated trehalose transporter Tret1 [Diabrotica virgifera virgifera]|uniref:Major facilitator superfamily (MFS) profile domain-containing protein n=1 Tax=Diabrotica virgifera virgifera TaxID=50390 RepID=A0ABM5KW21_DIAVI|nr:facilitated trehalose transporter Tret1 [Diabrotica virgifera virgifera]